MLAIPFAAAKSEAAAWEKAIAVLAGTVNDVAAKVASLISHDAVQDAQIAALSAHVRALDARAGIPPPPFYDGEPSPPDTDDGGEPTPGDGGDGGSSETPS